MEARSKNKPITLTNLNTYTQTRNIHIKSYSSTQKILYTISLNRARRYHNMVTASRSKSYHYPTVVSLDSLSQSNEIEKTNMQQTHTVITPLI